MNRIRSVPSLAYCRRIFSAYLLGGKSHLTFWHETPIENPNANPGKLGEYYMLFAEKADHRGPYDASGVPQLDYHGRIGLQYNPIAIAQYGLGNYNAWRRTADPERKKKFSLIADWLVSHLEPNANGLSVWNHHFNWKYRDTLRHRGIRGWHKGRESQSWCAPIQNPATRVTFTQRAPPSKVSRARLKKEASPSPTNPAISGLRSTSSPRPRTSSMDLSGRSSRLRKNE